MNYLILFFALEVLEDEVSGIRVGQMQEIQGHVKRSNFFFINFTIFEVSMIQ